MTPVSQEATPATTHGPAPFTPSKTQEARDHQRQQDQSYGDQRGAQQAGRTRLRRRRRVDQVFAQLTRGQQALS